jgi:hypothetical protein
LNYRQNVRIIAVLAGLLLPALGAARRKADSVRCLNNLRQVGLALRMYAEDHDARLPRARAVSETNRTAVLPAIHELLDPYLGGTRDVYRCPEDEEGWFERAGSSYEWNVSVNGRILHRLGERPGDGDVTRLHLMRDMEPWHWRGRRNAVFADGRAGRE